MGDSSVYDDTAPSIEEKLLSAEATFAIRKAILDEEKNLRSRFPGLKHQDLLGLSIWAASLATMLGTAYAYTRSWLPWWSVIIVNAVAGSLLHELEHDLIHRLYWNSVSTAWVSDVMLGFIWVAKLSLNPWTRRTYHLLHHRRSGQVDDIEERLLGLGIANLWLRLLVAFFPPAAALWVRDIERDHGKWRALHGTRCSPERWRQRVDMLFLTSPLVCGALALYGVPAARVMLVAWQLPNVWRHACLCLMSSFSHYYGDIKAGDITQQNMVLSHWALLPLNAFCVNFGAEHIIHHFVVGQPFYLRHLVRHAAWRAMAAHGVRFNDLWVLRRANRYDLAYKPTADAAQQPRLSMPRMGL